MSLKVKFLKNHIKWRTGDTAVLDNTQALYLDKMGVAELQNSVKPEEIEKTLLKHLEPAKKATAKIPVAEAKPIPKKAAKKK